MGEMVSKLTIKTAEQYHWHSSSVFIVKLSETYFTPFSSVSLLTWNKSMFAGLYHGNKYFAQYLLIEETYWTNDETNTFNIFGSKCYALPCKFLI